MKTCTKCKTEKEFAYFSVKADNKDKLNTICKSCKNLYSKKYYKKTASRHNQLSRERYHANIEQERARNKLYRDKNIERIREKTKLYYELNKEKERARLDAWKEANPDRASIGRKKRRIQLYNAEHVYYTESQVIETYGTICHICKAQIDMDAPRRNNKPGWEMGLQIDHVVSLAKGGADKIENVRPSHGKCNLSKGKR